MELLSKVIVVSWFYSSVTFGLNATQVGKQINNFSAHCHNSGNFILQCYVLCTKLGIVLLGTVFLRGLKS